jgi:UDP-N-acetyl-D-galactosamine dehydrogenase
LNAGTDKTLEVSDEVLQSVLVSDFVSSSAVENPTGLLCSSDLKDIAD